MRTYYIKFRYNDEVEPLVRTYKATSPGHAFKKCLREFPGAQFIEGGSEGGIGADYGCIVYEPPSTVRIRAKPLPKEEEVTFPFYDDCLNPHRPF